MGKTTINYKTALFGLAVVVFAAAAWHLRASRPAKRPHVVLVIIDTLRADRLSCYGYPLRTSPEIDRYASKGVRFAKAVSQRSWTRPSVGYGIPAEANFQFSPGHGVSDGSIHRRASDVGPGKRTTPASPALPPVQHPGGTPPMGRELFHSRGVPEAFWILNNREAQLPEAFVVETEFRKAEKVGVYTENWKYFENRDGHPELNQRELQRFGSTENGRNTDLADLHPEVVERLSTYLEKGERDNPKEATTLPDGEFSPEEIRQLRSLGYIQ